MTDEHKHVLLRTAKAAVAVAVSGRRVDAKAIAAGAAGDYGGDELLSSRCGCFVTLKHGENLRGCLGHFESEGPLIELVAETAAASATADPRFVSSPITAEELDSLDIEISVLSPLELASDPLSLEVGRHGIYIQQGYAAGCLLPQVATEMGWSKEEFLSFCCLHKAGLPADAWKSPRTQVFLFTAEVFGAPFEEI